MSNNKMILFTYFRSSASWRLRLVLAIKGLEHESRPVNLLKKEHLTSTYKEGVNPMGQVPALQVEGHTFTQSVSIFEYLEETFPDKPLLPKDVVKRAKVREIAEVVSSGIHPIQNLAVLQRLPEDKRKAWAHDTISMGFAALEVLLSRSSGKYCVGDELTWADCCLVPQIFNANRFGVDMTLYPIISRIGDALEKLPAFQDAHPFKQPDCPDELK